MFLRLVLSVLVACSATAFAYYGLTCMYSMRVRREYRRYGIPRLRVLNGSLMLAGSGGLSIGLAIWPIGMLAAAGLTAMMLLGLMARIRLRDHWRLMVPAGTLAIVNLALVALFPLTAEPIPGLG